MVLGESVENVLLGGFQQQPGSGGVHRCVFAVETRQGEGIQLNIPLSQLQNGVPLPDDLIAGEQLPQLLPARIVQI